METQFTTSSWQPQPHLPGKVENEQSHAAAAPRPGRESAIQG
jgi:hypothetical protein